MINRMKISIPNKKLQLGKEVKMAKRRKKATKKKAKKRAKKKVKKRRR